MNNNLSPARLSAVVAALFALIGCTVSALAANPFIGDWALTIPGGGAGWLGVEENDSKLAADIMWGGGSALPVDSVRMEGDMLVLTRQEGARRRGQAAGAVITETITARRDGDELKLATVKARPDGSQFGKASFSGRLQPPLPPAPDLSKVRFGEPIVLFNGRDLSGWRLTPGAGTDQDRLRRHCRARESDMIRITSRARSRLQ